MVEVFREFRLRIQQMSDILPMEQVSAFQKTEVSPSFLLMSGFCAVRVGLFPLVFNRGKLFSFTVFQITDSGNQIICTVFFEDLRIPEIFFIDFR